MFSKSDAIQGPQLISFLSLYVSILIGWIAYYNYQPILLSKYNLESMNGLLYIIQGIIMVLVPPMAGYYSDQYRSRLGNRFPVIIGGIIFAGLVFMSVALTLTLQPSGGWVLILPVLVILWIISMSIFTSPAISMVELFTSAGKLPLSMSIIVVCSGLIYALEPSIVDLINFFGAPLTFVTGGVLVLVSGFWMRKSFTSLFQRNAEPTIQITDSKNRFGKVFLTGVALGVFMTLIFNQLPDQFESRSDGIFAWFDGGNSLASFILLVSAIVSIPFGLAISKMGLLKSYLFGLPLAVLILLIVLLGSGSVVLSVFIVLLGMAYSWLSVCSLPLALQQISIKNKVFGVGVFFAGVEFPNSIFEAYLAFYG
ncbi:MAG: hypothetical protein JJU28_14570 [Cyclobacteriaceae bacterium]|nr:hypothetical protein [Cyclobacteriaceae bacterium]